MWGHRCFSLSLIFCFRSLWREQEKIGRRRCDQRGDCHAGRLSVQCPLPGLPSGVSLSRHENRGRMDSGLTMIYIVCELLTFTGVDLGLMGLVVSPVALILWIVCLVHDYGIITGVREQ